MGRKDKRPESLPEHRFRDEASEKATDPTIFDTQGPQEQTRGSNERGPNPGQSYDKAPGHYTDKGTASGN